MPAQVPHSFVVPQLFRDLSFNFFNAIQIVVCPSHAQSDRLKIQILAVGTMRLLQLKYLSASVVHRSDLYSIFTWGLKNIPTRSEELDISPCQKERNQVVLDFWWWRSRDRLNDQENQ